MSIDVGIKTLAINVMSCTNKNDFSTFNILLWDIYNVMETEEYSCKGIQKNGKICNRKCIKKWKTKENEFYSCKSHFPKDYKILQHILLQKYKKYIMKIPIFLKMLIKY
jgi:hypothetical protein